MGTNLIESTASRRLARELASLRADIEAMKEGQRSTQLDFSTMLYPLIVRDPGSGDVIGTIGQQSDGGLALNRVGGPAPPAPSPPTVTPLMSGVLVEWDGTFTDPNYVIEAHRAVAAGTVPRGSAARTLVARGVADVGANGTIPPGKLEAAQLIRTRLVGALAGNSASAIFEDWTWYGCPSVVGTWNDILLSEYGGDPFASAAVTWLGGWIADAQAAIAAEAAKTGATTSSTSVNVDPGDWYIPRSPDSPEKLAAAQAILNRIRSGSPIGGNWTWDGAPALVVEWAADLQNEWRPSGQSAEAWLQAYVSIQDTRPSNFGYVGIHVGETQGFPTDPSNMVGVLSHAGSFPVSPVESTIWVRLVGYNDSYPPVPGPASDTVSCTPDMVVAQDVLDGIISETKLAAEAVATGKMRLAAVQNQILAAAAVQQLNLAGAAVTGPAIASSAITADHMSANAVYSDVLQAFSVIAGKIAAASISAAEILANSITADKLTTGAIQTGAITAGSVTTDALAALAVTADKIAANAILAGHITAGAITADKLAAMLVIASRLIAGDPTGTRAEMNGSGFEAWRGATKTFDVDSATGTAFMLGQFATADSGPRIVANPGGSQPDTLRFYPSNNDATWSSIDSVSWGNGQISGIRIVGSGTSSTANRGMVVVRDQYASLVHGKTDLTYFGAEVWVEQAFTRNKGAVVDLIVDERLEPWGGGRRVAMIHYDTSKNAIPATQLQYEKTAFNGGEPFLVATGQDCGLSFAPARIFARNNGNSQDRSLGCADLLYSTLTLRSSRALKRDERPLDVDPVAAVRSWRPKRFKFVDDPQDGPDRFGFIAEDMPETVRVTAQGVDAPVAAIDMNALVTLLVGAVQAQDERLAAVEARLPSRP